mgnify:CR=1 FL=1
MIKKEFARCVMVYRNVFSEEKIKEYLNIIKDSETKNTLYTKYLLVYVIFTHRIYLNIYTLWFL